MPNFFFQRYVHGERMADDVLITKQPTLEAAIPEALRLCRNSPKSVLVHVPEDNALSEEITRLSEENARLREALEPIVKIKAFTCIYECIYEWTPVEALRDDEKVRVKLTGAQIKKMREAAIREGGKSE